MKRAISSILINFMKSRCRLSSKIDNCLTRFHKEYENLDYDFYRNGEAAVLQKLADRQHFSTILDVGANEGNWSLLASKLFPQAIIHSFEIFPETYTRLVESCQHRENIMCHNIGLSDTEETASVYFSPDKSAVTTCVPNFSEQFHNYQPQTFEAEVSIGDMFCANKGIKTIDFLKIDVEGYEHKVLKGFEGMLKKGNIKIIQFEYGYINIDTHFLLKDFYDYLGTFEIRIGKIYPSYVDFREYRHSDENFYGPNYLAVHSSCGIFVDALGYH
jgi:FkbM family methyltransferase